jgi:branched-chain amino acid transport system ATP-binding protein
VLEVEGLTCRYGKVEAVRELTIAVKQGELVALIGANGAGKTTTLKAISGVLAPAAGRIVFLGEDITRASARRVLQLGIAHCPEGRRVFPYMTVAENLEMVLGAGDAAGIAADLTSSTPAFPLPSGAIRRPARHGEQQMLRFRA